MDDLMTSDEYIRSRMPHATVIEVRAALRSEPAALARLSAAGTLLGGRVQCAVCAVRVCASVVQCGPSRPVASRHVTSRRVVQCSAADARSLAAPSLRAPAAHRCCPRTSASRRCARCCRKGCPARRTWPPRCATRCRLWGWEAAVPPCIPQRARSTGGGMGVGLPGAAEAGQPWWGAGAGAGGGGGGVMNASASASAGGRAPDPTRPL